MKNIATTKSPILNYFELSDNELKLLADEFTNGYTKESSFVYCPIHLGRVIPLDCFLRSDGGRFHGYYSTGYWSAWGIILGRTGETALVSYLVS